MELPNTLYNELPRTQNDMGICQEHIKNLAAIIGQHGMTGKFTAELPHKHEDTPMGQVRLEPDISIMSAELIKFVLAETVEPSKLDATLKAVSGKWMKPAQTDSLDLNKTHAIVFNLDPKGNRLIPCEFAEGPIPVSESDTVDNLASFVSGFVNHVEKNNLANMIGLQLLRVVEDSSQHMRYTAESELGEEGAITLPSYLIYERIFLCRLRVRSPFFAVVSIGGV